MDSASPFPLNTRHGRNGSQSMNIDRQLSEASSNPPPFNHLRQNTHPSVSVGGQSRQTYHNRQNSTVCIFVLLSKLLKFIPCSSNLNKGVLPISTVNFRNLSLSILIIILSILLQQQLKDRPIHYLPPLLDIHHPLCIDTMDRLRRQVVYQ